LSYWVLLYLATNENQKPRHKAILEGSMRKIGEMKDMVIWESVTCGQKYWFLKNIKN
jgi:hypothetical protein